VKKSICILKCLFSPLSIKSPVYHWPQYPTQNKTNSSCSFLSAILSRVTLVLTFLTELVWRSVQNLVHQLTCERGTLVHNYKQSFFIWILANRAPALPGKSLMSLRHPSGHFTLHKVFSPVTHLDFGVWGTLKSRGRVGGVMLVLRTFPELVGRSV